MIDRPRKDHHLPDSIVLWICGPLCFLGIVLAIVCLVFAVKSAKKPEGELKMAFWSFGALAGLVFSGMCFAYFILPILINHWLSKTG